MSRSQLREQICQTRKSDRQEWQSLVVLNGTKTFLNGTYISFLKFICENLNRGGANSFWNHVNQISSTQMYFQDIYSNLWKVKVFIGNIYSLKSNTYFWGTVIFVQDGFLYLIVTKHKLTVWGTLCDGCWAKGFFKGLLCERMSCERMLCEKILCERMLCERSSESRGCFVRCSVRGCCDRMLCERSSERRGCFGRGCSMIGCCVIWCFVKGWCVTGCCVRGRFFREYCVRGCFERGCCPRAEDVVWENVVWKDVVWEYNVWEDVA